VIKYYLIALFYLNRGIFVEAVFENKDVIIINKPPAMPSQKDSSDDADAMTLASEMLSQSRKNSQLWLVHRLDRVVGGLMVFARNKQSAAELSAMVGGKGMEKEYLAVVEGEAEGGMLEDYIYKNAALGKAFIANSGKSNAKHAMLEYKSLMSVNTQRGVYTLVRIKLHTGRFHQIRVQFASRKHPLVGDGKYGSHDNRAKMPALFASSLKFLLNGVSVNAKAYPDSFAYPWSLFDKTFFEM
jgi:23S rRNA pseudouridine1911/1915/1917 synthase